MHVAAVAGNPLSRAALTAVREALRRVERTRVILEPETSMQYIGLQ